jgi:hypothetical protein
MGGTFSVSPKGYYTRTHQGVDRYQLAHTSDMTSPAGPQLVPVGLYGRSIHDVQRTVGMDVR